MAFRISRFSPAVIFLASLLNAAPYAGAQKVVVDADHVVNTFSPPHALGAAIDRLRTGSPDHLLKDPLLLSGLQRAESSEGIYRLLEEYDLRLP